ncbi:MAG: glycosyltransferase [Acidimicrobiales bacterium]
MDCPRTLAVGVVIPACNEERLLPKCLMALETSILEIDGRKVQTSVVVVLDSCKDGSAEVARAWQRRSIENFRFDVTVLECKARNVGMARALGCDSLLDGFRYIDLNRVWIATTDADSRVPQNWLCAQVSKHDQGIDVWAGRVTVSEWPRYRRPIASRWEREYAREERPIHGANFGVNGLIYADVGGFPPIETSEDRGLHSALVAHHARIHYDRSAPVITSARSNARAPKGFATALSRFDASAGAA